MREVAKPVGLASLAAALAWLIAHGGHGARLLAELAGTLQDIADALAATDRSIAERALLRARSLDALAATLAEAVQAGRETASLSPRWRSGRGAVATQYAVAQQLDLAVRNARVLARRTRRAVEGGEPVPKELVQAVRALALAVRDLDLGASVPARVGGRQPILSAASLANACLGRDRSLSVTVLIAQVRSLAQDLLLAIGLEEEAALRAIDAACPRSEAGVCVLLPQMIPSKLTNSSE
jgi:hypothetical protein